MTQPQTILITGATSGIGKQTALDFAARGHRVFATGRNPDALAELAESGHDNLTPLSLDVTDATSIASARIRILDATGGRGIDVLVNNAGYGDLGPTELIEDADMRRQFDTNVFGLMAVTRAFLPEMRSRRRGRIINVSSVGGRITMPLFGVYSASKYAVEALSDALRMEMRPFGIRVSLVEPGPIRTNFSDRALDNAQKYMEPTSPYARVVERSLKLADMFEKTGAKPEVITRAIHRAMTSRWPRARYVAPLRAAFMVYLVKALPTSLTDLVLRRVAGFSAKNVEPVAPAEASTSAESKAAA